MPDINSLNPQRSLVDLSAQANEPWAILRAGSQQSQNTGQVINNTSPILGHAVMEMLKQYQQGTLQPQVQGSLADTYREQAQRSASVPQGLVGASPGQQNSVLAGQAEAVQPTIQGYADILNASKRLVENIKTQQEGYKSQAHDIIANAINAGSEALKALDPETIKLAGYSTDSIKGLIDAKTRQEMTKNLPTSYQEYQLAKQEGYKGSYNDYQTLDANRKRSTSNINNYFGPQGTPSGIESYASTTKSGLQYIDGSNFTGKQKEAAVQQANAANIPFINKDEAEAIQNIDNARFNQDSIIQQVQDLLPKDASGRILGGALKNKLSKTFQTEDQLAAFSSWRTAAINTLRATAGSKGLRINQAEILAAVENDIPKITDTIGTAQQKFKNIQTLLDNAERSILVKNRSISNQSIKQGQTSSGLKFKVIK